MPTDTPTDEALRAAPILLARMMRDDGGFRYASLPDSLGLACWMDQQLCLPELLAVEKAARAMSEFRRLRRASETTENQELYWDREEEAWEVLLDALSALDAAREKRDG